MTYLATLWSWWKANVEALVADDDAPVPKSVFVTTSPMWWGELLDVTEED